jgi:DNA processing protein
VDDLKYWVALHRISGLGPVRFGKLEARFGSLEEAWRASGADLAAAGLDSGTVREVLEERPQIDPDAEMEALYRADVRPIHRRSPAYPAPLAESHDAPSVIYLRGTLTAADQRTVAVVGTRGPTTYGKEMARRLSYDLAATGVTVVSGLARGIDGIAHLSALDAGGRTLAIMGGGLDSIYPPEHTELAGRIAGQGAVISEYPLGMRPRAEHFPRRNRIISGLALGVVVVESDMDGGAMLTVKWALDQDREVFAVPGSVLSPKSAGPNWLIQQGAKLVATVQDILEELNISVLRHPAVTADRETVPVDFTDSVGTAVGGDGRVLDSGVTKDVAEGRVLAALAAGPMHVDDVTRAVGLPAAAVSSALAILELRGLVHQTGPLQYVSDGERRPLRAR